MLALTKVYLPFFKLLRPLVLLLRQFGTKKTQRVLTSNQSNHQEKKKYFNHLNCENEAEEAVRVKNALAKEERS